MSDAIGNCNWGQGHGLASRSPSCCSLLASASIAGRWARAQHKNSFILSSLSGLQELWWKGRWQGAPLSNLSPLVQAWCISTFKASMFGMSEASCAKRDLLCLCKADCVDACSWDSKTPENWKTALSIVALWNLSNFCKPQELLLRSRFQYHNHEQRQRVCYMLDLKMYRGALRWLSCITKGSLRMPEIHVHLVSSCLQSLQCKLDRKSGSRKRRAFALRRGLRKMSTCPTQSWKKNFLARRRTRRFFYYKWINI